MNTPMPSNPRFINLTGQVFGNLTVISYIGKRGPRHHYWTCHCNCGVIREVTSSNLIRGNTRSCGCLRIKISRERTTTHNAYHSPEYKVWSRMIDRCCNKNNKSFSNYGGRGIIVCEQWLGINGFSNFINNMGNRPTSKHSIERIDNNKNYEPNNCHWATKTEQNRNKRNNRMLTYNEITLCVTEWELKLGFPLKSIHNRLQKGWSVPDALTIPIRRFK